MCSARPSSITFVTGSPGAGFCANESHCLNALLTGKPGLPIGAAFQVSTA